MRLMKCIFIKGRVDEFGVSMGCLKSAELIMRRMEECDYTFENWIFDTVTTRKMIDEKKVVPPKRRY